MQRNEFNQILEKEDIFADPGIYTRPFPKRLLPQMRQISTERVRVTHRTEATRKSRHSDLGSLIFGKGSFNYRKIHEIRKAHSEMKVNYQAHEDTRKTQNYIQKHIVDTNTYNYIWNETEGDPEVKED